MLKRILLPTSLTILVLSSCAGFAPQVTPTATPTLTPIPTLTATFTPTPVPMVTVNEAVDCYAGPGERYDLVQSFGAGAQLQVLGQDSGKAFWIVSAEGGKECWIAAEFVTISGGEMAGLQLFIAPPTPTPAPPAAPSELKVTYSCTHWDTIIGTQRIKTTDAFFTLGWMDNANNEDGFNIYNGGDKIAVLDPNSTEYKGYQGRSKTLRYDGPTETYFVEAFNSAGESEKIFIIVRVVC